MQFLRIEDKTRLSDLIRQVGSQDAAGILARNSIQWSPDVGASFRDLANKIARTYPDVDPIRKKSLLNTCTGDSDVFEYVATSSEDSWKMFSQIGALPGLLRIPDNIIIPTSINVLGNGEPVSNSIYKSAMYMLSVDPYQIDPSIFNEYSSTVISLSDYSSAARDTNPFVMFRFPWGKVSLYSSLSGETMDFPVYPDEFEDISRANYTTMPDMLYQYEPWQVYTGSGPRSLPLTFHFHRDMWTGDHRDGKCNELIRFCEANCYPEYQGSAVITSTVTFYLEGSPLITGIMTEVSKEFSGPIGLDGMRLECSLKLSITEVSQEPLNYSYVRSKGLIG